MIVTIDGPSGAGKSSVAERVARELGIRRLDTGALYRTVAFVLDRRGLLPAEGEKTFDAVKGLSVRLEGEKVFAGDEDVTCAIRTPHVDGIVSAWAALSSVRSALLSVQRDQARYGSLVAEGRDMGTVVFPDADVRFFLTASPEARAERRFKELQARGENIAYEDVLARMHERDHADSVRELAPLKEPEGAIHVDTSRMDMEAVVQKLVSIVRDRMAKSGE
ncbi:MAG: (d)CMP kinase [Synergistaceae bacterium]|nr:(d)CMP kinase [Synergistaceae bacterium]